ncbi:MAG: OmpA family protein [Alphaproteobacteria bacterium]|nr:OmpA family protein [Alphaproteobacteria bacterium]
MVFFDWDKADLTAEARKIIATAAEDAKKGNVARIRATGHADRSGPDGYNMKLSMRRAVAVKGELARLGVAEKDIAVVAKGEREPLVPTADGVREPQNRRVEIVFE